MTYSSAINSSPVTLVEFYAAWCPHCQAMMPVVEQVKERLDGRVPVVMFDIDKDEAAADDAGVRSVPTFIIYSGGRVVWRHSGEIEGDVLLAKVESYL